MNPIATLLNLATALIAVVIFTNLIPGMVQ